MPKQAEPPACTKIEHTFTCPQSGLHNTVLASNSCSQQDMGVQDLRAYTEKFMAHPNATHLVVATPDSQRGPCSLSVQSNSLADSQRGPCSLSVQSNSLADSQEVRVAFQYSQTV